MTPSCHGETSPSVASAVLASHSSSAFSSLSLCVASFWSPPLLPRGLLCRPCSSCAPRPRRSRFFGSALGARRAFGRPLSPNALEALRCPLVLKGDGGLSVRGRVGAPCPVERGGLSPPIRPQPRRAAKARAASCSATSGISLSLPGRSNPEVRDHRTNAPQAVSTGAPPSVLRCSYSASSAFGGALALSRPKPVPKADSRAFT